MFHVEHRTPGKPCRHGIGFVSLAETPGGAEDFGMLLQVTEDC
jgi:hypothetical protein